jgi:hypothetical protein
MLQEAAHEEENRLYFSAETSFWKAGMRIQERSSAQLKWKGV